MKSLTEEQVTQFKRDGFLSPLPLLDEAERQECLQGLARYEAWLGMPVNAATDLKWRTMPYITMPWALRLATDPRIRGLSMRRRHSVSPGPSSGA